MVNCGGGDICPALAFHFRARGDDLKFGKGGLLKGPAILPLESSFCSLLVTLFGCNKADWEFDKKLVGESNSRLARYSSTKIGECMC